MNEFAMGISKLDPEPHIKLATYTLDKIQPSREASLEEQIALIREHLAVLYESQETLEGYQEAVKVLIGIPLDSGRR